MIMTARSLFTCSLLVTAASAAACSAAVEGTPGGGDDAPGDGTGSVRFLETTVRDERGDAITFTSGAPVHAHAGPTVSLDGTGCPAIYKHAYLLDEDGPTLGGETMPNPLHWQFELRGLAAIDLTRSAYRVRTAEDAVLLDWTQLPAHEEGVVTLALHRAGTIPIAALGVHEGALSLDIRTVDRAGAETVTSACWEHHPLAAPLAVEAAHADPGGLVAMTLLAGSPISQLLSAVRDVPVFSQRFVQHTAEPVHAVIDLAQPTATYVKRIVDDFVVTASSSAAYPCSDPAEPVTDPRCDDSPIGDPADATGSGALASGRWTVAVLDELTGSAVDSCTIAGLVVTCAIPPRSAAQPPRAYRTVLSVRDLRDLAPAASGPFGEHVVGGLGYTGVAPRPTSRCNLLKARVLADGSLRYFCAIHTDYTRIVALDHARVAFAPVAFRFQSAPTPALPPATLAHVPPDFAVTAPITWDAGDDDLPGPQ
ncbi:MAG: hypothetical protein H0X17_06815 [Deltaproteobacteria bacterium]|nr:hypothetical protein [Deltaproteobacteria bacterium]